MQLMDPVDNWYWVGDDSVYDWLLGGLMFLVSVSKGLYGFSVFFFRSFGPFWPLPCITCVQCIGVFKCIRACSVHWGCIISILGYSVMGDIISGLRGYHHCIGRGVQCIGGGGGGGS